MTNPWTAAGSPWAPKKESYSPLGLLSNLLGDIGHAGLGLGTTIASIPVGVFHLGQAAAQGHGGAQAAKDAALLKSIGLGMLQQMKDYYGPLEGAKTSLFTGHPVRALHNIERFGQNVYDHPLQLGLDALTVATAGGGALAKAGSMAAKAGEGARLASAGERIAGLSRITKAEYEALPQIARKGILPAKDGTYLVPKRWDLIGDSGQASYSIDLARNPVVRGRQVLKEKALGRLGEDSAIGRLTNSYFHPTVRGERLAKAARKRQWRRAEMAAANALAHEASKASRAERYAAYELATTGIRDSAELAQLVAWRTAELARETSPKYRATLTRELKRLNEAAPLIAEPTPKVLQLRDLVIEASNRTQASRLARGAKVDATAEQIAKSEQVLQRLQDEVVQAEAAVAKATSKKARAKASTARKAAVKRLEAKQLLHDQMTQTRATLQRRLVGLPVDHTQQLAIVSHSADRMPRSLRKPLAKITKDGGYSTVEDLLNTGTAYTKGLHESDPMRVAQSMLSEMRRGQKLDDYEHLLQVSARLDPSDEAQMALVAKGKLVPIRLHDDPAHAQLVQQVGELSRFINERLAPAEAKSAEMGKMLADWIAEIEHGPVVVPAAALKEITKQTKEASGLLVRLLKTPTRVWRDLTLSLKGSFYVNNFLGNLMLGFIAYGPKYFAELVLGSGRKSSKVGKLVDEMFPDMQHGGAANTLRDVSAAETPRLPAGAVRSAASVARHPLDTLSRVANKFAEVGAVGTENNFRRAATGIEYKRAMREIAKRDGISLDEAADIVANDAKLVDAIAERAYGNMLDYSKLTDFEKEMIRPLYPFWSFIRAITGRAVRLTLDEPWKVEVMRHLSQIGVDMNKAGLFATVSGDIPSYAQGLVATGAPGKDGRTPVYSTYAANPFSAVGDLALQAQGLIDQKAAGEAQSPFASWNPYLRSGVEAIVGKDMFSGTPLYGSYGDIYTSQLAKNFPQYASYDRSRHPNPDSIVSRSGAQQLAQYFGLPVGRFSPQAMKRSLAIEAHFNQKDQQIAARAAAKRQRRDIGWDLGLRDKVGV